MSNLEVQGNLMRVPPPKELSKSMERRRSSDETLKSVPRRSVVVPAPRKPVPKATGNNKSDETDTMKAKIINLEEEIRRLKRRIEELEKDIVDIQKQSKSKEKRIADLTKENDELKKSESNYEKQLEEFRVGNNRLTVENIRLQKEIDRIQQLQKSAEDSAAELNALKEYYERQMQQMRDDHQKELKARDEKIAFLKKQISESLKDNSWERQQQIEELTKQLKRTHDEYEVLRHKLLQYQNKKGTSHCGNCSDMQIKIEEKTKALQEKDVVIKELLTLMTKFKSQLSNQDELVKLLSTYNNASVRH
ncbi:unnamed protein product [Adineta ricciae]|uniref:Uncharacterized protein n=1 Tax=Adineta ricciae TaxID=249248 RepID=A0A814ELL2_ADIRI|nr:unnamed protein product [Adineta ricciae]CAF1610834.1 unnamed protein product [Adineta ricciae]